MKKKEVISFVKKLTVGLLALGMLVTGIFFIPKQADAAAEVKETVIYTEYSKEKIEKYWSETTKTAPVEDGYVFGGWFQKSTEGAEDAEKAADGNYYAPLTESDLTTAIPKSAYAKFVPAQVLSIKAQNQADIGAESSSTHVRIISSADSTNYKKFGFEIYRANTKPLSNAEGKPVLETTYLYTGLKEGENVRTVAQVFGGESEYLFVWQMNNVGNSNFKKIIYARPYWVTKDGTTVNGLAKYVHIEDEYNGYISVPVNIARPEDVAAGTVDMSYYGYDGLEIAKDDNGNILFEKGRIFPEMTFRHDAETKTIKMVGMEEEANTYKNSSETIYANIRFKRPTVNATMNFDMKLVKFCNWDEKADIDVKVWDIVYEIKTTNE